jgi:hypothetical protein
VAGLPVSVLAQLRFRSTAALVGKLASQQDWLAAEAQGLSDALYLAIGAVKDERARPRLVGLRRALHQIRCPAASEWSPEIRALLPAALVERTSRWLRALDQQRHGRERLPAVLEDELARQRAVVWEVAADPGFQRALCQSSPALFRELEKWLISPERRPRRQVLVRLAKYLARAATKTSPFSTFMVSGFAAWSEIGPALRLMSGWEPRGVVELHGRLRDALANAFDRSALRDLLVVQVNPSVTRHGDQLSLLGRAPEEPIVTVPATPTVVEVLRVVEDEGPISFGALRENLTAASGNGGGDAVRGFLARLVAAGVLTIRPPADRASSPEGLARWLMECGGGDLDDVVPALYRLGRDLRRQVPVVDVSGYRQRQESLRHAVNSINERLGLAGIRVDRGLPVAQDSGVVLDTLAECGKPLWRPALDDLDVIRRWLALFNPVLALRLTLPELWRRRFAPGGRAPFLLLHRAVQEEVAGGRLGADLRRRLSGLPYTSTGRLPAEVPIPRIRELRQLRDEALRPFREVAEGASVVRVEPSRLARLVEGWPSWVEPWGSAACYLQPVPSTPDGLHLVLNRVDTGYGKGRSRVAHLIAQAGGKPPPDGDWAVRQAGPALAELGGTHGSTLNDRMRSVPHEISYPFTAGARRAAQLLPLHDLVVTHDPDRDLLRLRSTRLGTEVMALDLGMLARGLLPPAARLLCQAFGGPAPFRGFPAVTTSEPAGSSEVRYVPRAVVGRVVLRRAGWVVDATGVPRREAGEPDGDYLLRLTQWRRAAGIPTRCFVRALPPAIDGIQVAALSGKDRKPAYVDFENWLLTLALEKMLRSVAGSVVFEEALPDPETAAEPSDGPRVIELLVEVSAEKEPGNA